MYFGLQGRLEPRCEVPGSPRQGDLAAALPVACLATLANTELNPSEALTPGPKHMVGRASVLGVLILRSGTYLMLGYLDF